MPPVLTTISQTSRSAYRNPSSHSIRTRGRAKSTTSATNVQPHIRAEIFRGPYNLTTNNSWCHSDSNSDAGERAGLDGRRGHTSNYTPLHETVHPHVRRGDQSSGTSTRSRTEMFPAREGVAHEKVWSRCPSLLYRLVHCSCCPSRRLAYPGPDTASVPLLPSPTKKSSSSPSPPRP